MLPRDSNPEPRNCLFGLNACPRPIKLSPDLSNVENLDADPKSSSKFFSSGGGGLGGGDAAVASLAVDIRFSVEKLDIDTKLVDRSTKLSVDDSK